MNQSQEVPRNEERWKNIDTGGDSRRDVSIQYLISRIAMEV